MSIIKTNAHQIGIDSVTAANNFTLQTPTTPNGTLNLYRGNANAPLSTIFTVDTANNVNFTGQLQGNGAVPSGAFQHFMLPAAPTGWIAGDGSTFGSAASGATRANADTQALFTAWWSYTDVQLPIYTSAGTLSARGASAAADWAANKRLTVFDVRDRVARTSGTIQPNGTKLEATQIMVPYGVSGTTGVMVSDQSSALVNVDGSNGSFSVQYGTWAMSNNVATPLSYSRMRVASIGMLGCFKL